MPVLLLGAVRDGFHAGELNMLEPRKVRLEDGEDCDCSSCGVPLMPGEAAWRCDTTFVTGCCRPCCADAARSKLALFGEEVAHA